MLTKDDDIAAELRIGELCQLGYVYVSTTVAMDIIFQCYLNAMSLVNDIIHCQFNQVMCVKYILIQ